ncbi:MAG: hypothetical protein JSR45_15000 [Proteobacteria bacterium]|nr:hypothetical protein [Pseudomonadota bacterium]
MSHHNIVGSEAFDDTRPVLIRTYRRRGRTLRGYAIAAFVGGVIAFVVVGLMAYFGHALG